jgi:topoisomerase-4 subunit B
MLRGEAATERARCAPIFERGILKATRRGHGRRKRYYVSFEPDNTLFKGYSFHDDIVETMLRNYTYLNSGLTIMYNGSAFISRNGLEDLLNDNMTTDGLYPSST